MLPATPRSGGGLNGWEGFILTASNMPSYEHRRVRSVCLRNLVTSRRRERQVHHLEVSPNHFHDLKGLG